MSAIKFHGNHAITLDDKPVLTFNSDKSVNINMVNCLIAPLSLFSDDELRDFQERANLEKSRKACKNLITEAKNDLLEKVANCLKHEMSRVPINSRDVEYAVSLVKKFKEDNGTS